MEYDFSWAWFFGGLGIIIVSVVFIRFHQWIADNFGSGVADYEHYKLYGLIALAAGFLAMINLVPVLLGWIAGMIFGGRAGGASEAVPLEAASLLLQLFI